MTAEMR